jgi:uncharacterized membrane protein
MPNTGHKSMPKHYLEVKSFQQPATCCFQLWVILIPVAIIAIAIITIATIRNYYYYNILLLLLLQFLLLFFITFYHYDYDY